MNSPFTGSGDDLSSPLLLKIRISCQKSDMAGKHHKSGEAPLCMALLKAVEGREGDNSQISPGVQLGEGRPRMHQHDVGRLQAHCC